MSPPDSEHVLHVGYFQGPTRLEMRLPTRLEIEINEFSKNKSEFFKKIHENSKFVCRFLYFVKKGGEQLTIFNIEMRLPTRLQIEID